MFLVEIGCGLVIYPAGCPVSKRPLRPASSAERQGDANLGKFGGSIVFNVKAVKEKAGNSSFLRPIYA
ncbi:hypothetical protein [Salaquimonas pukyongi]|uniref:hypothetical protein n=1 Tax=Salaquimonas pukyongi TaxID=2712698 RepID=UPI0019680882|nr:hypothetical protein [Salaquimonas pukyongi]